MHFVSQSSDWTPKTKTVILTGRRIRDIEARIHIEGRLIGGCRHLHHSHLTGLRRLRLITVILTVDDGAARAERVRHHDARARHSPDLWTVRPDRLRFRKHWDTGRSRPTTCPKYRRASFVPGRNSHQATPITSQQIAVLSHNGITTDWRSSRREKPTVLIVLQVTDTCG